MFCPTVDVLIDDVQISQEDDLIFNTFRRDEDSSFFDYTDSDHNEGMRAAHIHVRKFLYPSMPEIVEMLTTLNMAHLLRKYTPKIHELAGQCYKAFLTERMEDVQEFVEMMTERTITKPNPYTCQTSLEFTGVLVLMTVIKNCPHCNHVSGRHIHNKMCVVLGYFIVC